MTGRQLKVEDHLRTTERFLRGSCGQPDRQASSGGSAGNAERPRGPMHDNQRTTRRLESLCALVVLLFLVGLPDTGVARNRLPDPRTGTTPVLDNPDPPDPPSGPAFPTLNSSLAAIVVDASTGEYLGGQYAGLRWPMASTTKIMSALLVIEDIKAGRERLDRIVTVSQNAGTMGDRGQGSRSGGSIMGDIDGMPQDASIGLSPGDTVSIRDLLYGMLLDSGNDAAIALAESLAGTESAFVARMNARAVELGLRHTHYANSHGRDPSRIDPDNCPDVVYDGSDCAHHSNPRDLATLAIKALSHPLFATIVNTPTYNTRIWSARASGAVDPGLDNSNDLIRRDKRGNPYLYPGGFGIKTGTTDAAGACLVAGADSNSHPEDSVVTVVLDAANDDDRYIDTIRLLDFGFAVLEHRRLLPHVQVKPQTQWR